MKFKQGWTRPEEWWMCPQGVLRLKKDIPDYLNDLNDVHELEKIVVKTNGNYWFVLAETVSGFDREDFDYNNEYFLSDIICATAAQRCEALLKTLNLWKP